MSFVHKSKKQEYINSFQVLLWSFFTIQFHLLFDLWMEWLMGILSIFVVAVDCELFVLTWKLFVWQLTDFWIIFCYFKMIADIARDLCPQKKIPSDTFVSLAHQKCVYWSQSWPDQFLTQHRLKFLNSTWWREVKVKIIAWACLLSI